MSENFGSLLKNILPGLALVAIGTGGAFLVYKTSFEQQVAQGFAEIEPVAGYSVEIDGFGSGIDTSWLDGEVFPPQAQTVSNKTEMSPQEAIGQSIQNFESIVE